MLKKGETSLQKQLQTYFKKHSSGLEVHMRSFFGLKRSYKGSFLRDKDTNLLNLIAFKHSKLQLYKICRTCICVFCFLAANYHLCCKGELETFSFIHA